MKGMIGNLPVKDVGFAAMALGLALLAGCTVGPNFAPPDPPAIDRYTPEPQPAMTVATAGSSGAAQRLNPVMDIPAQWWMLFQSPELDRLVRQALANSPSLVQAGARLKQAQEEVNTRSGQTTYPNVSASISARALSPSLLRKASRSWMLSAVYSSPRGLSAGTPCSTRRAASGISAVTTRSLAVACCTIWSSAASRPWPT